MNIVTWADQVAEEANRVVINKQGTSSVTSQHSVDVVALNSRFINNQNLNSKDNLIKAQKQYLESLGSLSIKKINNK